MSGKLSISTQMFLDEMNGKLSFDGLDKPHYIDGHELKWEGRPPQRPIASPDTIDGQAYISAFIRLYGMGDMDGLKSLGVEVQSVFKESSLMTALIPVDRLMEVAKLDNVKRISVAKRMTPSTNVARQVTHADDVLTYSADAICQGLNKAYDGTGVVLGVIDCGIDFQHIAFKDSDGNSRICRAYVYDGSHENLYTSVTASEPTTDDYTEDHGTHTSTTAGGSSVIVTDNNTTVTVTSVHANATYGGMAPGASLFLAGVKGLGDTYLTNAVNNMVTYALNEGKPLVVSNSWGSQWGPHDGTGDMADVYNDLFSDSDLNRIALFAASNDAGKCRDGETGGYHVGGLASALTPLGTIVRANTISGHDGGYLYANIIANAYVCSTQVPDVTVKIHVLNSATGVVMTSETINGSYTSHNVRGLSSYYSGTLYLYFYQVGNKTQAVLYTPYDGSTYFGLRARGNYTLAMEVYPTNNSAARVDIWGGNYGYFTNHLTTTGHTWTAGSDDMCVSDEATIANVISVGAYVSKNTHSDYTGQDWYDPSYTVGDIAPFSSYATAEASPTGLQYPWITAPGARLAAGVNHYHTIRVDDYSYYGSNYNSDLVVNNTEYPYAMMEGTSMATPVAAGIVALWLQQASEHGVSLTVNDVKELMSSSAIHDGYTNGTNASHFGNGKINALGYAIHTIWAGSGTQQEPYQIATTDHLDWLATRVNCGESFEGKYFQLTADLDYNPATSWNDATSIENNFTPIGGDFGTGADRYFCGHFDGAGHTISGIRIYNAGNTSSDSYQGLFGQIKSTEGNTAEVKGITLSNTRITGFNSIGGIVGYLGDSSHGGIVEDCHVTATVAIHTVQNNAEGHGGIVGLTALPTKVSYCTSAATLTIQSGCTGCNNYGGIVGKNNTMETYIGSISHNLAIGATIPAANNNTYGAISGVNSYAPNNSIINNNYYYNCTVAGVANATNAGSNNDDVTANDGAVPLPTRTIAAGTWHTVATPMHDYNEAPLALDKITGLTSGSYDLFYFDEPTGTWINQKPSDTGFDTLQRGCGYIYRRSTEATLPFIGFANTGTINVPLTTSCTDADLRGFHLVGNPYPHNVAYSSLDGSLATGYYALQPNGTWLARTDQTPIGVGQAVLVQASQAGNLTFSDQLPTEPSSKSGDAKGLAFTVTGSGYEDVAYAMFSDGDGLKKIGHLNEEAPSLSIPIEGTRYAIATIGAGAEAFPLEFNGTSGEYTISIETIGTIESIGYLHLIDRVADKDIDLLRQPTYTFSHSSSQAIADRFLVRLRPEGETGIFAYQNGNSIVVEGTGMLQVFDVMGRQLFAKELSTLNSQLSTLNFPFGVYVLRLNGKIQKIVIR